MGSPIRFGGKISGLGWVANMSWEKTIETTLKAQGLTNHAMPPSTGVASVLVSIRHNPASGKYEIILTKRSQTVKLHKGQVSFPGGFYEMGDSDLKATAIRETCEELGITHSDITILGILPPVETLLKTMICPWVALLNSSCEWTPNRAEVEKVIVFPMNALIEGMNEVEVEMGGRRFKSIGIHVSGELVWGATARILEQLHHVLLTSGAYPFATK